MRPPDSVQQYPRRKWSQKRLGPKGSHHFRSDGKSVRCVMNIAPGGESSTPIGVGDTLGGGASMGAVTSLPPGCGRCMARLVDEDQCAGQVEEGVHDDDGPEIRGALVGVTQATREDEDGRDRP